MTALMLCFAVPALCILALVAVAELFGKKKTWDF